MDIDAERLLPVIGQRRLDWWIPPDEHRDPRRLAAMRREVALPVLLRQRRVPGDGRAIQSPESRVVARRPLWDEAPGGYHAVLVERRSAAGHAMVAVTAVPAIRLLILPKLLAIDGEAERLAGIQIVERRRRPVERQRLGVE